MRWLVALVFFLMPAIQTTAQDGQAAQQKIDQLSDLLQDPDVQSFLKSRTDTAPQGNQAEPDSTRLVTWEATLRDNIAGIVSAIPRIPTEIASAALKVRADALTHGYAPVFVIFAGLVAVGLVAERIYLATRSVNNGPAAALAPIAVFSLVMALVFFAVEWPQLVRVVLLAYLLAFVIYRLGAVVISLTAQPKLRLRLKVLLATIAFALPTAVIGSVVSVPPDVANAISFLFSIAVLAFCIEMIWSCFDLPRVQKVIGTVLVVAVWLLWCFHLRILFWLAVYAFVLPGLLRATERIATILARPWAGSLREVLITRAVRALVVVIAAAWLAVVWRVNPESLGHTNPTITAIFYGLLKSVVILLLADLAWQIGRSWIDRTLVASSDTSGLPPADAARRARFRTLLPILRNALAVIVIVMTVLIILAELGVEIGPLIAGAGIFGVALGFGSQTLVKDVISGVFYMLDDAFRVGEYIQAKNYKGTVEGFSLRSVRLRHHRGPVYTVPFGELGAVENMSRDWGVVKFRISVGYDTDLEKARKLTKKIGAMLLDDPELGKIFIEPLKMKGLEEFGDYGLVLSFGMTLKPSPMQSFIRRRANLLLREVFTENGIEFATPSVQVGGGDAGGQEAAAAASAVRMQQAKASAGEA